jgi:osmotically-inducible protein OsmY
VATMKQTDAEIQRAVLRELERDTRVEQTEVGIEVDEGVVTLAGTVTSWAKRHAAQEAAHRAAGVLDVANDIEVTPVDALARTDTEIAHAVRRTLEWDVFVPDQRIQSTVSKGWVTLEGEVDFWHEREEAERAVRTLVGLRGVTNRIRLSGGPARGGSGEVRASIQEALARHAERVASRIELTVTDGKVTVVGRVASWAEKQAVLDGARSAPSIEVVEDQLMVDPDV